MVMGKLLGAMDLILDFNNSLRSKSLNRNINDKDKEKQETTKKKNTCKTKHYDRGTKSAEMKNIGRGCEVSF